MTRCAPKAFNNGVGRGYVVVSADGQHWQQADVPAGTRPIANIAGGGGHFVCIYGYTEILGGIATYFDIDDPIYGKSSVTVSDFTSKYQTTGSWTHTYFTKSYIHFMPINPLLLSQEVLQHIQERRPLLGVKAGLPADKIGATEELTLGLAHPIFTLGLHELLREEARATQTGVRVMEFSGETPKAFYDVADAQTGKVQQMAAASPYLELLPRALGSVGALAEGEGLAGRQEHRVVAEAVLLDVIARAEHECPEFNAGGSGVHGKLRHAPGAGKLPMPASVNFSLCRLWLDRKKPRREKPSAHQHY
jgi:hypothetical protein